MDVKEAAALLGLTPEKVRTIIKTGMELPKSGKKTKLGATKRGSAYDISEKQLDNFIKTCESEQPGGHPPVKVRRELLVEAKHRCAVCRLPLPLQFHHMVDWARVRHHDASHMLAVCELCHGKCTRGEIDYPSQQAYKAMRLRKESAESDKEKARKQEKDSQTLRKLFRLIPRPRLVQFFDEASCHRLNYDILDEIDVSYDESHSPIFHLYDKELWRLIREFFAHWRRMSVKAGSLFVGSRRKGIAVPDPMNLTGDYRGYERELIEARHAFFVLNSYVLQEYPEVDLEETDRVAVEGFEELERRAEETLQALMSGRGRKKPARKKTARKPPSAKKATTKQAFKRPVKKKAAKKSGPKKRQ